MSEQPCGCCQGAVVLTPAEVYNRPGLDALRYRAGVHATFLETMKARLWRLYLEAPAGTSGEIAGGYPLRALATREPNDPAIALLDAWATVADVLTFYQERIANEGYLRTATERRSVLELARLVGYRLRPGVAASAFLAFLLDKDCAVEIPRGTRATEYSRAWGAAAVLRDVRAAAGARRMERDQAAVDLASKLHQT